MIESGGDLHEALVSFLEVARIGAGSDAEFTHWGMCGDDDVKM